MRINFNIFKTKPEKDFWFTLAQSIFRIFFVTFVIFFIVEYIFPGFITSWFNPIWLLIIVIISGIISLLKK